jgi:hypothetical protein
MKKCESLTSKGSECKKNARTNESYCHIHIKNPLTTSKKFLNRFPTLVHDLGEDMANRLPKIQGCQNNTCTYCSVILTKDNWSVDHVIRLVKDSRINPLTNLSNFTVPCCKTCNSQQIGQQRPVFTEKDITIKYRLDCEDEIYERLENIKLEMMRIDELVQNSQLNVVKR